MNDDFGKDNSQDEIALELAKHEEAMEEAAAEEAFIADEEDVSVNPLVPEVKEDKESGAEEGEGDEILGSAFGSGELNPVGTPFNNEEAFKDESAPETDEEAEAEAKPEEPAEPVVEAEPKVEEMAPVEEVKEMNNDPAVEKSTPAPEVEPKAETPLFASNSAAPAAGEAPKKKKKGLVILVVVLLLLIAGGLAAFFIIRAHEAPERQISDAIEKLYTADATQFSGEITFKPKVATGTDSDASAALAAMINIKLSVEGASKGSNASGSGKLSIGIMGQSMEASVSGAYIANDGIYFKLDGLGTLAESMNLSDMISGAFDTNDADMDEAEAMVAEEISKILLSSILEKLDGDWYKIDSSSFEAGSEEAKTYSCVNEAMGKISSSDTKKQIAEAYKKHPVILYDSEKDDESSDGLTFFAIKADEKASEELAKELKDVDAMKSLSACLDSSAESKDSSTGTDIKVEDDKTKTDIKLGITGWTHELKAVKGNIVSDSLEMVIDIKLGYEDKAVNAPEGSKNVSGLMDEVKKDVSEKLKTSSIWDDMIASQCADAYRLSNGRMTPAQCQVAAKEELNKRFETESYKEMIDEMFEKMNAKSAFSSPSINL